MSGLLVAGRPERGELRRFLTAGAVTLALHGAIFLAIELSPGTVQDAPPIVAISVGFTEVRPTASAELEEAEDGTAITAELPSVDPVPTQRSDNTKNRTIASEETIPESVTPGSVEPDTVPRRPAETVESVETVKGVAERASESTTAAAAAGATAGATAGTATGTAAGTSQRSLRGATEPVQSSDSASAPDSSPASGRGLGETDRRTPAYDTVQPQRRYVKPDYPSAAQRAGIEGTVVVSFLIDGRGRPRDVEIIEGSDHVVLDREVLRAVQLWRFSRDEAGRTPVHRVEFQLKEEDS